MHTHCARCGSADLLAVDLAPAGRSVTFRTCRGCENRWWEDRTDARLVALDNVLAQLAA